MSEIGDYYRDRQAEKAREARMAAEARKLALAGELLENDGTGIDVILAFGESDVLALADLPGRVKADLAQVVKVTGALVAYGVLKHLRQNGAELIQLTPDGIQIRDRFMEALAAKSG